MASPSFAIVDDDAAFASMTVDLARGRGFTAHAFHRVADAFPWLAQHDPDLTLLDMKLPDGNGFDVLDRMPAQHRGQVVFVATGADLDQARRAAASHVAAYVEKPLPPTRFLGMLDGVHDAFRIREHGGQDEFGGLLGESAPIRTLRREIRLAAPHDVSVLLHGETGSGKELSARALHASSGRTGRFVPVNCGGIPAELLASELFGHERGSFTGASARHCGFFEQAHGGTLFLDEIGEMPAALQVYLLRVLETGTIQRLGGAGEVPVDVRIVAATHCLSGQGLGNLRQDLYFRLAHYPIEVPSLRERKSDIALLANAFIDSMNRRSGGDRKRLDERCLPALNAHSWPGNVRELAAAVEFAFLRSADEWVRPAPLVFGRALPEGDADCVRFRVGMSFQQIETEMLRKTLDHHGGDKTATARSLGVSVRTVHNHLARISREG